MNYYIKDFSAPSNYGGLAITEKAYQKSLNNLGLDYVDLYLIHFPGSQKLHHSDVKNKKIRDITWSSLEELYDDGRVNAIGVSNFTIQHLTELLSTHSVVPAVNQVFSHLMILFLSNLRIYSKKIHKKYNLLYLLSG